MRLGKNLLFIKCSNHYPTCKFISVFAIVLLLLSGCSKTPVNTDTLFHKMDSAQTNVDFINRVEDQPNFNILDYMYFYDGGGVAVGDINNDDLPDIYFAANMGANRLYLNNGNFSFTDVTQTAGVASKDGWSTGTTMADVNGDGLLDIYVCQVNYKSQEGHNLLYINNGDSTFTEKAEEYGLDFEGLSTQAAFFDYDKDGDLDMYLLNHSQHSRRSYGRATKRNVSDSRAGDRLYRNDGNKFTNVTKEAGIYSSVLGYGLGVAVSDINKDGWPDVYIGNDFHENDYLYINNGDGTFSERLQQSIQYTSQSSMGNDIADINNDTRPDIVSLDMRPGDRAIFQRSGSEDSDRITRIKEKLGYAPQISRNTLQLNRGYNRQGGPLFSEIGAYAGIEATDWSWSSLLADLNNDGWKDLYVTNGIVRRPNDLDYINFVSRQEIQEKLKKGNSEFVMEVIKQMPSLKISNYAYNNNKDLTFTERTKKWGLDQPAYSNGAAYGDLDRDGDLDLVVNNINSRAFIYKNRSDTLFNRHYLNVQLKGDGDNSSGIGTKVIIKNGDQSIYKEQMPTRGFQSSVSHSLHFGLGQGISRVDSLKVIWPDDRYQVMENVAVDQHLVVRQENARNTYQYEVKRPSAPILQHVTSEYDLNYEHKENVYSDFKRQPLIPKKLSTEGPALATGDVNGDGLEDLYAGGARGQAGKLFIQTKAGNFKSGKNNQLFRLDWGRENVDATFVDVDGDGDQDMYVVNGGGGEFSIGDEELRDRLYLNDGNGVYRIAKNKLPTMYGDGATVSAADYDQDGDIDLFIGNRSVPGQYGKSPNSYLLENNGQGVFKDVTGEVAPDLLDIGMITDSEWTDVTGDSRLDLVIVGEWMPVTILQNVGNGLKDVTEVFGLNQSNGWWNTLTTSDFDGDGDKDIVAGNLGTNSVFEATSKHPLKLYLNDFDNNGIPDPIIAEYEDGAYYPSARLDELLLQFPDLRNRIGSYERFSKMTVEDLFDKEKLEASNVKKVYTLETSYFENNDQQFSRRPLPQQVQFAPVQSMIAGDFDGDSRKDLLVKGNFYGADTDQGRYDAGYGLLLRGDNKGSLKSVPAGKSGFIVKGEGRAIRKLDISDESTLIFVALNDTTLQVYQSRAK